MIHALDHMGLRVSDIPASLAFYRALGARILSAHTTERGVELRSLQIADGVIELIRLPGQLPGSGARGIDHLAFLSDDLDTDYPRLLDTGCVPDGAVRDSAVFEGRLGFLRRPNGARIELLEQGRGPRPKPAPGVIEELDHFAHQVENLEESREFFERSVGMSRLHEMATPAGAVVRSFLTLGADVLGLRAGRPEPDGHYPHFVLRVEDVDVTLDVLASRGIRPAVGAADSPSGRGRTAFLTDPDGIRIELLDRPSLRDLAADGSRGDALTSRKRA